VGKVGPRGYIVGVDLKPLERQFPDNVHFIQADVQELRPETLLEDGRSYDLILSDLAPNTTGVPSADASRSADLVLSVLALAQALLHPGGALLAKVFQGSRVEAVRRQFIQAFKEVTVEKPPSSRKESVEVFLLGQGKW